MSATKMRFLRYLHGTLLVFCLNAPVARAQTGPTIAQQPASQNAVIGSNATFAVTATGTAPLSYQWFASLPVNTATATADVLDGFVVGATVTSGGAGYSVPPLVQIVIGAGSGAVAVAVLSNGAVTAVNVTNAGSGYGFVPIITIAPPPPMALSGQTNPVLTLAGVTAANFGNYLVVVSNLSGSVTSSVATLGLGLVPTISVNPQSQTVAADSNAAFSVVASAAVPISYQWQLNGTNVPAFIFTVAGGGGGGDGGYATNAGLNGPFTVAVDATGNMFIGDFYANHIRKVMTNGIITTVAETALNQPNGVAVDGIGNLFISDSVDTCVREVATNGAFFTVAGVLRSNGFSGDGGKATNATLQSPGGVTVDSAGNVFISDSYNGRIRKVDNNGIITTVAGGGSEGDGAMAINASLNNPRGTAVDSAGDLFIAVLSANQIRKVDANGIITTVAGNGAAAYAGDGGPATAASLNNPYGVAVDASGNLFITDHLNFCIREVTPNGIISTVAGNGVFGYYAGYIGSGVVATNGCLGGPYGVALDSAGRLYFGETSSGVVRKVTLSQEPTLEINNVQEANIGNYQVIVSSLYGSVTSSVASLALVSATIPPAISQQPQSQSVLIESNATLTVVATGSTPLSYQWSSSLFTSVAAATALVTNGFVYGATVTRSGSGYTNTPLVQIVGGGGSGASAVAVTTNGAVTAVNVTNAGSGYTGTPVIEIVPPPPPALVNGQTNGVLNLGAATPAIAGSYFVTITNAYGSITSAVATLAVALPPLAFSINAGGVLQLQFNGNPSSPYVLQSATNLTPPVNWQALLTNSADTNGNWTFTTTNATAITPRFYRLAHP